MDEEINEDVQFKMRLDTEVDDSTIPTQVDELRIEKLSHRVTLISILIPVLIVVILGVAYVDMKRRVIRSEDTGAVTVQHLSEELESRFSSLSLSQAQLEEALSKFQDQTDKSLAKAQVGLQKLDDSLKRSIGTMASQKDIKTASRKMDQGLANVAQSTEEIKAQVDLLGQSVQTRLGQMDQQVAELNTRMAELKKTLAGLEKNKIDKPALDLALALEMLKVKQVFNVQLEKIQGRLQTLEQKASKGPLLQPAKPSSQTAPQVPRATGPSAPSAPSAPSNSGKLQEQTIGK